MAKTPIGRILVVCAGNICRSPMAEALLRQRLKDHPTLKAVDVSSAGTIAYDGNPPSADAVEELHERYGLDINSHRARSVTRQSKADLVLTMDRATTATVEAIGLSAPVLLLGDFVGTGEEVADPYGGPRLGYRRAAAQLDRLAGAVVARLVEDAAGERQ